MFRMHHLLLDLLLFLHISTIAGKWLWKFGMCRQEDALSMQGVNISLTSFIT